MTKWLLLVVCLGIACQDVTSAAVNHQRKSSKNLAHSMKVIYEWKHIDYDFGSVERRDAAIKSGEFDHTKNYPFDVDRWRDKTFVTVERFDGVPSSLNVVTNKKGKGGPLLHPYPDWSWANYKDCSGIVSAFKIAVDKFDRLWVLDSGLVNNNQPMCSPKLVTFDLTTSKLLKQVEIPHNIAVNATTGMGELVSLAVQAVDPTNTMVYIADERGEALIIYQNSDDSFHRLTSNTFDYDPRYTKLTVAGESFTVKNGICGIALSPVTNNLYYSPLASHSLYYVNTEQFRNPQYEESNVQYEGSQDILNTQSFAKAVSKNGVVFLGLVSNSAVGCVNEHQVLQKENFDVVAQNEETLQMIVSMKIMQDLPQSGRINDPGNEYMLALSNKMQKIINNDFNFNDVNFRILGANVNDLTRNTRCAKSNNQNANNQNANNQNANNQNANNQNANNQNDNNQNDNGNNRRNGNNQNGNRQNDNKQNDNKQNANKQNANKQNDNKQNGNRQNDNRQNDNKQNDNRQNDNKQNGNRQNDNRQNDNQRNGNRQNDNRQNDNKRNGNRQNDNRQNDNKRNGNRQNDNKQNDNRQNDNNQNNNQNDNNRNNQAHHS